MIVCVREIVIVYETVKDTSIATVHTYIGR